MFDTQRTSITLKHVIILAIAVTVIAAIPLRVVLAGYLPGDDAKRHAAKVVSGNSWSDILLLRNDAPKDTHPGWHKLLGVTKRFTGWDTRELVWFSVVSLSLCFGLSGLLFVRYPESWLLALAFLSVVYPPFAVRVHSGRPLILSMVLTVLLCFQWENVSKGGWKERAFIIIGVAVSTWLHGTWYLLVLPVMACVGAKQWRSAREVALCTICGIFIGAFLTGSPWQFIKDTILLGYRVFMSGIPQELLVDELQPMREKTRVGATIFLLVLIRWVRRRELSEVFRDPVVILTVGCYALGFRVLRFWCDWGVPALAVWLAREIDTWIYGRGKEYSRRIVLSGISAAGLMIAVGADWHGRWSNQGLFWDIRPIVATYPDWVPGKGGLWYFHDMRFFYDTFFLFPCASWKYVLGFEPTLMPPEDLAVFIRIRSGFSYDAFLPWIRKMRPEDRLVLTLHPPRLPPLPQLEWRWFSPDLCVGRLRRDTSSRD